MKPILFELPLVGWPVSAYHTFLTLGFVAAIWLAYGLGARSRVHLDHLLDMALVAVVGGILGSRAFYYAEFYDRYFRHRPWYHLFYVHQGGYVFYGGFLAAVLGCVGYLWIQAWRARRGTGHPVAMLRTLDVCAPAVPIGLALGRLGCFLNGCCWGRLDGWIDAEGRHRPGGALLSVCFPQGSYAWESQHIRHGWIPADAAQTLPVHATQLYSAGGALLVCAALLVIHRLRRRDGQVAGAFFLLYAPLRFVIEAFREHDAAAEMTRVPGMSEVLAALARSAPWLAADGTVTYSQLVSLALFGVGLAWFGAASLFGPPVERAPRRAPDDRSP